MLPRRFLAAWTLLSACWTGSALAVDFNLDVRPILSDKCFACHGPDEHERKAGLRLDTLEGAMEDLGGYAAFVAGDPDASEAFFRMITEDPDEVMPPPKMHKPMTAEEIEIIRKWIEQGAEYQIHWAYDELKRPEVPDMESDFVRNEVDPFILRKLEAEGREPALEADPITLIRRLHLDLTGLPPTQAEVDAFLKDTSPDAWEKAVDRVLENPAYGERMAVYWLDLVRYADSIGYHSDNPMEVSAYRDYVIEAFNENKSWDQFTIEQLAGDLLPEPTLKQRIASGYNRLLQTTEEGGAQPKEYMAIHAADRVRNVSAVFMGSTVGCAQCHDHKYDPFTMRDFYTMAAFFDDIQEKPIGKRVPNLKLPTPEEEAEIADLQNKLQENTIPKLIQRDEELRLVVQKGQQQWVKEAVASLETGKDAWSVTQPADAKSSGGAELQALPDGSLLSTGRRSPDRDNYSLTLKGSGKVTAIRLEALTHESLGRKSLSRGNGNFVLTNVKVSAAGQPVKIASAQASYEQGSYPVAAAIDADPKTGWAVDGQKDGMGQDRLAVFTFENPVDLGEADELLIQLQHQSAHAKHNIGRVRLSLTDASAPSMDPASDLPLNVQDALRIAEADRTEEQKKALAVHYQSIAPELAEHRENLVQWKKRLDAVEAGVQTMLVSQALETPRVTRVLDRGNWQDESGEIVEPAVPAFLPHTPVQDRRATRLDLAEWIVADTNPLPARTMANRLWKLTFGKGISRNLDDLGGQGEPPTHPELLDWLAVEFQESGWDMRHMLRLLVTSGAYRQSSTAPSELLQSDPDNRLYARQGRWRLDAEFVRDTALQTGGLLVHQIGGKSVKPYQPAGYWAQLNFPKREWQAGEGESLYRRSLYTFWSRSFLHPAMMAFDAPSREECSAERARSNIPQQALVLLNDPQFVEAARSFAQRIAGSEAASVNGKLQWAWQEALSRAPDETELKLLRDIYESQLAHYKAEAESASDLIAVGASEPGDDLPPSELAAWTQVARVILNAYETTARF